MTLSPVGTELPTDAMGPRSSLIARRMRPMMAVREAVSSVSQGLAVEKTLTHALDAAPCQSAFL